PAGWAAGPGEGVGVEGVRVPRHAAGGGGGVREAGDGVDAAAYRPAGDQGGGAGEGQGGGAALDAEGGARRDRRDHDQEDLRRRGANGGGGGTTRGARGVDPGAGRRAEHLCAGAEP